jgi:hypothetical protein
MTFVISTAFGRFKEPLNLLGFRFKEPPSEVEGFNFKNTFSEAVILINNLTLIGNINIESQFQFRRC